MLLWRFLCTLSDLFAAGNWTFPFRSWNFWITFDVLLLGCFFPIRSFHWSFPLLYWRASDFALLLFYFGRFLSWFIPLLNLLSRSSSWLSFLIRWFSTLGFLSWSSCLLILLIGFTSCFHPGFTPLLLFSWLLGFLSCWHIPRLFGRLFVLLDWCHSFLWCSLLSGFCLHNSKLVLLRFILFSWGFWSLPTRHFFLIWI